MIVSSTFYVKKKTVAAARCIHQHFILLLYSQQSIFLSLADLYVLAAKLQLSLREQKKKFSAIFHSFKVHFSDIFLNLTSKAGPKWALASGMISLAQQWLMRSLTAASSC